MRKSKVDQIEITLTPHWCSDTVGPMDIFITADICGEKGDCLFSFQKETVTVPFCTVENMILSDDSGEILVTENISEQYPIIYQNFITERQINGKLKLNYRVLPRDVSGISHYGPYFDFRNETGGANGAGVTFLPLFSSDHEIEIFLNWDLKHMPEDAAAVSSFGKGNQHRLGSADSILYAFYAAGQVHCVSEKNFGFYWFSDPRFDIRQMANNVKQMFFIMADFFEDPKTEGYSVFARKDPFDVSGGTALHRSFLFGYNNGLKTCVGNLQNVLAHEIVHNWPHMDDEPYGSCTWFVEGTAEFYSIVLPYRHGITSLEDTLFQIQDRTDQFFKNPTIHLSNSEAAQQFWKDKRTQRLMYGRGLFFIANIDSMMRRRTNGKKSVDDVVKMLTKKYLSGQHVDNQSFIDLVHEVAGLDITKQFSEMELGHALVPDQDCFDSLFNCVPETTVFDGTQEKTVTYRWKIREIQ